MALELKKNRSTMKLLRPLGILLLLVMIIGLGLKFNDGIYGVEDKIVPLFLFLVVAFVLVLGIRKVLQH